MLYELSGLYVTFVLGKADTKQAPFRAYKYLREVKKQNNSFRHHCDLYDFIDTMLMPIVKYRLFPSAIALDVLYQLPT